MKKFLEFYVTIIMNPPFIFSGIVKSQGHYGLVCSQSCEALMKWILDPPMIFGLNMDRREAFTLSGAIILILDLIWKYRNQVLFNCNAGEMRSYRTILS